MAYDAVIRILALLICCCMIQLGMAIQCYQCDSNEDTSCPAEHAFDTEVNAVVDCSSFEANIPGHICMKTYQQSSGWRPWIKITRRCASYSDTGVSWGCRWEWDDSGVFNEICYCKSDGCNAGSRLPLSFILIAILSIISLSYILV